MDRRLDLLVDGLGFGESPRWHEGRLWYSDFLRQRVSSVVPGEEPRIELELDDRPEWSRMASRWPAADRLHAPPRHVATRGRWDADSACRPVRGSERRRQRHGRRGRRNGLCGQLRKRRAGRRTLSQPAQLALVRPDGTVSVAAQGLSFPNGSVITPDGAWLIVGETLAARYTAFPIGDRGDWERERSWAEVKGRSPDGCTLDAEGAIWFADASGGGVAAGERRRRNPRRHRHAGHRLRLHARRRGRQDALHHHLHLTADAGARTGQRQDLDGRGSTSRTPVVRDEGSRIR